MPRLLDIFKLCRPADWSKNSFVLIAVVFWLAHYVGSTDVGSTDHASLSYQEIHDRLMATLCAFASFCLVASGSYCINDAMDAAKDRAHPVKCRRPVASGAVSPSTAIVSGIALIAGAFALASTVRLALVAAVGIYIVLQVAYNGGLKRVAILDVTTIATGFALRAAAGALAIGAALSVWLVLCVFFLCLYLAFIKRTCDLVAAQAQGSAWKSSAGYDDRNELNWLLGVSATLTLVMYVSYTLSEHATQLFGPRAYGMALLTPLVLGCIHRFWRRANRGGSDSPLSALRDDKVMLACALLYLALLLVVLFVPSVSWALGTLFLSVESKV